MKKFIKFFTVLVLFLAVWLLPNCGGTFKYEPAVTVTKNISPPRLAEAPDNQPSMQSDYDFREHCDNSDDICFVDSLLNLDSLALPEQDTALARLYEIKSDTTNLNVFWSNTSAQNQ